MDSKEWYDGGFRGHAPPIEFGTVEEGQTFRVKDLWCSIWYTRFIGSEEECEQWIKQKHKTEAPMKVNYQVEKYG